MMRKIVIVFGILEVVCMSSWVTAHGFILKEGGGEVYFHKNALQG